MRNSTPPDIDFTNMFDEDILHYAGYGMPTIFFQSLSLLFDAGEAYFCRSVQAYRDMLSKDMQKTVNDFCRQEAQHSRVHRLLNASVEDVSCRPKDNRSYLQKAKSVLEYIVKGEGSETLQIASNELPARGVATFLDKALKQANKRLPDVVNLAATIVLEHLTASLANIVLEREDVQEGLRGEMKKLWLYHAIDEVEHEHVAREVWQEAIGQYNGMLDNNYIISLATPVVYSLLGAAVLYNMVSLNKERVSNGHNKWLSGGGEMLRLLNIIRKEVRWSEPFNMPSY